MQISQTLRNRYVELFKQLMVVDQCDLRNTVNLDAFRNNMMVMKRINFLNKNLGINVTFHDIKKWLTE